MTEAEIREYLQNYRNRKTIADYKVQNGRKDDRDVVCIQAIENCMRLLPDGLGDILRMHYIERKSLRKIAAEHFYCKDTIAKRRDEAIALMGVCLASVWKKAGRSILLAFFMVDYPLQKVVIINCAGCHF